MGRITTLLTKSIAGNMTSSVAAYIYPSLSSVLSLFTPLVLSIFDAQITNAAIAGFATSIVSVVVVLVWANRTKNNRF